MSAIEKITRHPSADLAVLTLAEDIAEVEPFIDTQFGGALHAGRLGIRFYAFGYPEDFLDYLGPRVLTPRLFVGYVQRYFAYRSFAGFAYQAAELSLAPPEGLSGGPVFLADAQMANLVFGVVADHAESYTQVSSEEIIDPEGEKRTVETRSVISYGVAVLLGPLFEWFEEQQVPSAKAAFESHLERMRQRRGV